MPVDPVDQPPRSAQNDPAGPIWTGSDYQGFAAHEHPGVRQWGLARLALLYPELVVPTLVDALGDPIGDVADTALRLLEGIALPPVGAVRSFLDSRELDPVRRLRALDLLSTWGDAEATAQHDRERREMPRQLGVPLSSEGEDDEYDDDEYDDVPPRAVTEDEAPALRRRAIAGLGGDDLDESADLLLTLARCRWRWAPLLVAGRLDALLASEAEELTWRCISELGDPSLLDATLAAWRPGERTIAAVVVFLARLANRVDGLPPAVIEEGAQEDHRRLELTRRLEDGEDLFPASSLMPLRLRCTACGRTWSYEVERVMANPEVLAARKGSDQRLDWDGYVLSRVVVCKGCGAQDEYELTAKAHARITAELMSQEVLATGDEPGRIVLASLRLRDGSTLRRPTQGFEHLRALAEREPEAGEGWRRLGNLYERFGLDDEAEEAWRRAATDEDEAEAAYRLAAKLVDGSEPSEGIDYALAALKRLPQAEMDDDFRGHAAADLCSILRGVDFRPPLALMATWLGSKTRGQQVVHVSSADFRDISDWDRLAELIGSGFFISLGFTDELPKDDSQLLALLGECLPAPAPSSPAVRSGPKVGRNAPCFCGSGRKYKRCCLRSER